jgi:hypothetical protein
VSQQQPSEEELRAALEEQMRHIRVEDVLLQTIVTLINLGARRLGLTGVEGEELQPEQARLAIDGARALVSLVPEQEAAPIRDALSQLQMAYVQRTGAGSGEQGAEEAAPAPEHDDAAARDKARSKIWTPPGT